MTSVELAEHAEAARATFAAMHAAREVAYAASRDAIRHAANAIRAVHRGEAGPARQRLADARTSLEAAYAAAGDHPQVLWSGFVQDAAKEYAEARLTDAATSGRPLPGPHEVGVDVGSWLHGVAETIGELRRACLDHVRLGDLDDGERLLATMQELLEVLAVIDAPDGLTRGLRRAADAGRAIVERTRGDLTAAAGQHALRAALDAHAAALSAHRAD